MRYRRAVEKLQILAEACESVKDWQPENPFLLEAYAFGDVLRGGDPLECVEVVLVLNLPSQDVVWGSSPHGTVWLADRLRLSKGGFCYWWRSHLDPVWNHHVQEPVRFWSHDGPDEDVLRALAKRRFADLPRQSPSPTARRDQLAHELDAALSHLREVRAAYWDDGWRREHRGLGRYPEHELWEAVDATWNCATRPNPGRERRLTSWPGCWGQECAAGRQQRAYDGPDGRNSVRPSSPATTPRDMDDQSYELSLEWRRKGATLSDKTARQEFGLTQDEIYDAIDAGTLHYRRAAMHGNPWLRLLRREVEALARTRHGERYVNEQQARAELTRVNREIRRLQAELAELEERRAKLSSDLGG